jgi:hypothetical protein
VYENKIKKYQCMIMDLNKLLKSYENTKRNRKECKRFFFLKKRCRGGAASSEGGSNSR